MLGGHYCLMHSNKYAQDSNTFKVVNMIKTVKSAKMVKIAEINTYIIQDVLLKGKGRRYGLSKIWMTRVRVNPFLCGFGGVDPGKRAVLWVDSNFIFDT